MIINKYNVNVFTTKRQIRAIEVYANRQLKRIYKNAACITQVNNERSQQPFAKNKFISNIKLFIRDHYIEASSTILLSRSRKYLNRTNIINSDNKYQTKLLELLRQENAVVSQLVMFGECLRIFHPGKVFIPNDLELVQHVNRIHNIERLLKNSTNLDPEYLYSNNIVDRAVITRKYQTN